MAQFKVGDVVQLKSGGPKMTVTSIENGVWCTWFAGTEVKAASFEAETLEAVKEAGSTESRSQPIKTGQWS